MQAEYIQDVDPLHNLVWESFVESATMQNCCCLHDYFKLILKFQKALLVLHNGNDSNNWISIWTLFSLVTRCVISRKSRNQPLFRQSSAVSWKPFRQRQNQLALYQRRPMCPFVYSALPLITRGKNTLTTLVVVTPNYPRLVAKQMSRNTVNSRP